MSPDWIGAIANAVLALGAVGTGIWATWTYHQAKQADAARWQKQIFDDLFLSGKFEEIREALELDFDRRLGRAIELCMQDCDRHLPPKDRKLLFHLDNFLNLIEYVLYLEQDRHQIGESDREALLGYWLNVLKDSRRSSLRYYAAHYGYERIAALTGTSGDTFLVLYGSLRWGQPAFVDLGLDKALEFLRPCQFDGQLYHLGAYPGAMPGKGKVTGEVYRVRDPSILSLLDEYEEFDDANPNDSLFIRRCIHVDGVGDAWVYLYNRTEATGPRIPSGDWLKRDGATESTRSKQA
jgi:gamma-glutamylcyclotransferase (GGCT)/AIG2-like uncharacterized protein YtfP